jgi:hypothetical protein
MSRSILLFSLILLVTPALHSQETPSLGDLARQARAEKSKQASAIPSSPVEASVPSSQTEIQTAPAITSAPMSDFTLHEVEHYDENIRVLFNAENFDKIDELADAARSTKARLTGGFWDIHVLYGALTNPPYHGEDPTESEWKIQLDRLQRWVTQKPKSVTARVALAGAYINYAWYARGAGYADGVTEQGWQLFAERLDTAAKILADAYNLPVKDPEWFVEMQLVLRAQQRSMEMQTAFFEKAIAFDPDYHYFYRMQAETLLPKWEGEEGQMALFAEQAANRVGGTKGDIIYYEIAAFVNCSCDARNQAYGLSWPRIKRGYAAVEKQYGASLANMNLMAKFAGAAGDPDFANEMFTRIGDYWDQTVWHKRENFDRVRTWAGFSQIEKSREVGLTQVDVNLKTVEGQRFNDEMEKAFQSAYGKILESCRVLAGETKPVPFDLILRVGRTGLIEDIFFSEATGVTLCVAGRVAQGRFPNPPQPSYWTRISVH